MEFQSSELKNATEVPSSITSLPPQPVISSSDIIEHIKYKLATLSPLLLKQFNAGFINYKDASNANEMLLTLLNVIKTSYIDSMNKDSDVYRNNYKIIEAIFENLTNNIELLNILGVQPNSMHVQSAIAGNIFRNL